MCYTLDCHGEAEIVLFYLINSDYIARLVILCYCCRFLGGWFYHLLWFFASGVLTK